MRRPTGILIAGLAVALLAACGGGSETSDPGTVVSVATPASTATTSPGSGLTPISAPATPAATGTAPNASTPEATPTTVSPSPTNIPVGNTPAPTQAVPPTPTTKPSSGNPATAFVGVSTTAFRWSPAAVTIAPGGSVTFAWNTSDFHDLSIPAFGLEYGPMKADSHTVTFPEAGTYPFVCQVHSTTMRGTVTVQ